MTIKSGKAAGKTTAFRFSIKCLIIFVIFLAAPGYVHAAERITDDVSGSLGLMQVDTEGVSIPLVLGNSTDETTVKPANSNAGATSETAIKRINSDASAETFIAQPIDTLSPASGQVELNKKPNSSDGVDILSKIFLEEETYEVIGSSAASDPRAEELFKAGTDLFNSKRYVDSKEKFDEALVLEPNNDVYKLALEMVVSTMQSQGIKIPEKKAGSSAEVSLASGSTAEVETTLEASLSNGKTQKRGRKIVAAPPKPTVRSQVLTCVFDGGEPGGNIIFNLGINTDMRKSDIYGHYVSFSNERDAMALAVFKLDCEPKKAMLLITQKIDTDDNNFVFPLFIKVNNAELIHGGFRLSTEFRPYQFDIAQHLHRGLNQLLFQTTPYATATYGLSRIEVFIQNY